MLHLILKFANRDKNLRAAMLNDSLIDPSVKEVIVQDFKIAEGTIAIG